jgi:glycogen debranching enzyme
MDELIKVDDRYYILASSSRIDDRTRVLKDGDTFAVFDRYGDMHPAGLGEQGIYHEGTRFLSRFELSLDGERPLLLSSTVRDDNALLAVDLANADRGEAGQIDLAANVVHVFRSIFLWEGICYQRLRIHSFELAPLTVRLRIGFDADFADIFEVRGVPRERRGRRETMVAEDAAVIRYQGLDDVTRRTRITCSVPCEVSDAAIVVEAALAPKSDTTVVVTIACEIEGAVPSRPLPYADAFADAARRREATRAHDPVIESSSQQFNDWLNRSAADLHMLLTAVEGGEYPYAGVPWYSTVFGRDGLITAYQHLWVNPSIARGVLTHLARHQAETRRPDQDAEPGKILHETRKGEMAALGEVPFGLYYGSIDATPLFVVLAEAYLRRTGDRDLIASLWPNICRALEWIDRDGDVDGDGFVEYERHAEKGLANQGWKDSHDSVFHADGRPAEGPIALCEVQGYVYAARRAGASIARTLGETSLADQLDTAAEALRERFEAAFWSEAEGTYALALDGRKAPCRVRTSNAGHLLWSGIAAPARAARVAEGLMGPDMYTGWGIRTLAAAEARFNPMSYHNGSVWPHDNALIAAGFARYGLKQEALQVLTGLFDTSLFVDLHRLPELFCGFERRPGEGPTLYPVACAPQAWAVGAAPLLLQVCLGLSIDGAARRVEFRNPVLPAVLDELRIGNLTVADGASIDVTIHRYPEDVAIKVTRRTGDVEIVSIQ